MSLFSLINSAYLQLRQCSDTESAHDRVLTQCVVANDRTRWDFVQASTCFLWRQQMKHRLAPEFWRQLYESLDVFGAVERLYSIVTLRRQMISRLSNSLKQHSVACIVPRLNTTQPHTARVSSGSGSSEDGSPMFERTLDDFVVGEVARCLSQSVDVRYQKVVGDFLSEATNLLATEDSLERASRVTSRLEELKIFGPFAADIISALICRQLRDLVQDVCGAGFDRSFTASLKSDCANLLLRWRQVLPSKYLTDEEVLTRLVDFTLEVYARHRIDQLFDIIIDFPESRAALYDLRSCLQRGKLRSVLVKSLRSAVETRLLHPAANTDDILSAYVSAVRALKLLEPSGVLVQLVGQPIHQYLRGRDDTVRCIITSLTEENGGVLADELMAGDSSVLPTESDMSQWRQWTPYPRDAPPPSNNDDFSSQSDILSMLVSIYGSKSTFVKEYRKLLADRILKHTSYNIDREYKYLELLKLRFGENEMHECEVMLKDIFNSQRINTHIRSSQSRTSDQRDETDQENSPPKSAEAEAHFPVSALILSAQFWPDFREDTLVLPDALQEVLERYTHDFQLLKGNRTLQWRRQLGSVRVQLELGERCVELDVTPTHAVILYHFQQRHDSSLPTTISLEELSQLMRVSTSLLRRKAALLVSNGILLEVGADMLQLNLSGNCTAVNQNQLSAMEEDLESMVTTSEDQKQKNLDVFWNYIVGMLTNLDSLPLDRIQSMLRVFALDEIEQCSTQQLRHFLDRKVRDHKLVCSGGLYRLPKI